MLEYNLDDAEGLLDRNRKAASKSLEQVEDDLGFLRNQTTTIEVSILVKTQTKKGKLAEFMLVYLNSLRSSDAYMHW